MVWQPLLDRGDLASSTPVAVKDGTGAVGTSETLARSDHEHAFEPAGDLDMGGFKLTNLAAPVSDGDAANKGFVMAIVQGLDKKESVRFATTADVNVAAGGLAAGTTHDGVVAATGDRALVRANSVGEDNGIYIVPASGAASRAPDADTSAEVTSGMYCYVSEGATLAASGWVLITTDPIVLGTTQLTFTQFSGAGQITAGAALLKTGNVLDVQVDGSSIEVNADALRVKAAGITNAMLAGSIANTKLATNPLDRTNHTGSQTAATISDFATAAQAVAAGGDMGGTLGALTYGVGSIVNADINAGAAIAISKLELDPRARSSHSGTQLANTISDFDTQVRTSRVDQMAAPQGPLDFSHTDAVINGLKAKSYTTAARPTEQTGRIIHDSTINRLVVSR